MTVLPDVLMQRVFPDRPVPAWLRRFAAEPVAALSELLAGHADLGHMQAADGVILLRTWIESVADDAFTSAVDRGLADWIDRFWGDPLPEFSGGSPAVTSEAWMAVGDLIWSTGTLPRAAQRLRELLPARAHFLRSLSEGLSRDPEASAWLAVASYQTDQSLLKHWWNFVNLHSTIPWYHGRLGIEGLRRLPQPPEHRGRTPREVQEGLFRLGEALALRVDEGWLSEGDGRSEFLRAARDLTRAYPSGNWKNFFRDTAARARVERYREWLKGLGLSEQDLTNRKSFTYPAVSAWPFQAGRIAGRLRAGEADAVNDAVRLLDEQYRYVAQTGDSEGYERSVGRLANAAISSRPNDALIWLDQGLEIAPANAHLWNLKVKLLRRSSGAAALPCAREAFRRFPNNDFVRNSLGQVLLETKRYQEAERVLREAMRRFPDDVFTRNGLGQALLKLARLEEAEQVFRETMRRSPDNGIARNGLGQVLLKQARYEEAEQVFRETMRRSPDNDVARNSLGQVLLKLARYEEAEQVFRAAMRRSPDEDVLRNSLGQALIKLSRYEEAEQVFRETMQRSPENNIARQGLERAQHKLEMDDDPGTIPFEATELGETDREDTPPASTNSMPDETTDEVALPSTQPPVATGPTESVANTVPASVPPPTLDLSWRQQDLEILLTDVFFQRMWARARGVHPSPADSADLLEITKRLFRAATDPTAAGEYGLLEIDRDEIDEAREFLALAVRRFPGSGRIRYAFARAQREWAAARQLRLDDDRSADVLRAWDRLPLVDARLMPVVHLGKARAWLALKDGHRVEVGAGESFSRLASLLQPHLESGRQDFLSTWSRDTHRFVFDTGDASAAFGLIRERVADAAVLLNEQEEIYVKAICP